MSISDQTGSSTREPITGRSPSKTRIVSKRYTHGCQKVAGKKSMYEPFADTGNKVLERAQCVHKITRKIELLIVQEKAIRDACMRNPFLLLVPEHVYIFGDKREAGTGKEGSVEVAQETSVASDYVEANEQGAGATKPYVQARNYRTGTAPFMARDVLNTAEKYTHGLHHDLESFLYAAVWHGVGYRGYDLPENKIDLLAKWRKGNCSSMLIAKEEFMSIPRAMERIVGKIQNKRLARRCKAIWTAFARPAVDMINAQLKQEEQDAEEFVMSDGEGLDQAKAEGGRTAPLEERKVSYAEWMKMAKEKVDVELHCRCCNATK